MPIISRLSLTARLTLLAIATLCPLAILIVISYSENRSNRHQAGVDNAVILSQSISTSVEGFTRDLESFSLAIGLTLAQVPPTALDQTQNPAICTYLKTLSDEHGSLRALFLTGTDGKIIATTDCANSGRDQSDRLYIQALKDGASTVWTPGLSGQETTKQTIAFGRVIRNVATGQPQAFLIVAFYADVLAAKVADQLPEDANFVLVTDSGRLMFTTNDPDLKSTEKDLSDTSEVHAALLGRPSEIDGEKLPFDTDKRFGALVPVSNLGWVVGFTRPQSALDASLFEKFLRDLALFAVIGAISLGAFALSARHVSRPLASLSRAASAIAAGNRVDVPEIAGDPDVVRLRDAFHRMATAVADREDRLREQTRVLTAIEQVGARLASELDYQKAVIGVRETGRELTEAADGVFFYVTPQSDGSYELKTLAGVRAEEYEGFPLPANMATFALVLEGKSAVRVESAPAAVRNGDGAAMRSYLAIPVASKEGEVMGALFFAHPEPGHFTNRHEELAMGVASWAAIALENAGLYSQAQTIQEELRQANRSKDEFLGLISHELRTPTTTIYGGVRLLQMRGDKLNEEEKSGLIENISSEASRLVRLIENLLALARLDLGREVESQPFSPSEVAWRVTRSFQQQHPSRPVQFESEEDIPSVMAEPTYFEQILMNLLTNADKYSPPTEPIEINASRSNGEVRVVVRDHGPGVPAEELPNIFDSFYRSETTASKAIGHGLGLTVCKRLVEAQSGKIWAQNRAEGGLEVGFAFPLRAASEVRSKDKDAAPA